MNNISITKPAKISSFTDLLAWKEAHKLLMMVYEIVKKFPQEEKYALAKQIRSAVSSITSNIAEGFSRRSWNEKVQFYSIALGSLTEVQNQLLISKDVGYISQNDFAPIAVQSVQASKLLNGLIKKTKTLILNS